MTSKSETRYQNYLVDEIRKLLPGCWVQKNDSHETQGIPDLLVLHGPRWAMLEVKVSASASVRPNQPYYIDVFNTMSFAAFIYPENEEEVLHALQRSLGDLW